jgi:uncharacterized protein (TIGR01244 family)
MARCRKFFNQIANIFGFMYDSVAFGFVPMTDSISPVNSDYSSAGQLTPEQIKQAAEQGFRSILNLRSPHEPGSLPDEAEQVAAAGLAYAQAPVSPTTPEGDPLEAALAALNALPTPVLIHCRGGGRATAVALVTIARQARLSRAEFLERAQAHGLGPEQPQIQQFLRDYYGDPLPDAQVEVV